jgi:hypothetical protein
MTDLAEGGFDTEEAGEVAEVKVSDLNRATQLLEQKQQEVDNLVEKLQEALRRQETLERELADRKSNRPPYSGGFGGYSGPGVSSVAPGGASATISVRPPPSTGALGSSHGSQPFAVNVAPVWTPSSKMTAKMPTFSMSTGNIEVFLKKLDNYFKLYQNITDEQKIAMLLSALDDTAFEIVQHITIPTIHAGDYAYILPKHLQRTF